MTNAEILSWFQSLAPTRDGRYRLLREMMRHAQGDKMSADDMAICRRVLHGDLYDQARNLPEQHVRIAPAPHYSAQPCGCDPGANWKCEEHR